VIFLSFLCDFIQSTLVALNGKQIPDLEERKILPKDKKK
jgi:hypothetical protein